MTTRAYRFTHVSLYAGLLALALTGCDTVPPGHDRAPAPTPQQTARTTAPKRAVPVQTPVRKVTTPGPKRPTPAVQRPPTDTPATQAAAPTPADAIGRAGRVVKPGAETEATIQTKRKLKLDKGAEKATNIMMPE